MGEALSNHAAHRFVGAHGVRDAQIGAVRIPEVELAQVAREVRFRDVVERPGDPALEDREVVFDRVQMVVAVADVLAAA